MDYIKNVQLSVDNIEILTKIIAGRYLYLKREYDNLQPLLTTTDEVEGSKLRKTILPARPMLALNLETKGHTETYTDAESFLGELKNNLRDVEKTIEQTTEPTHLALFHAHPKPTEGTTHNTLFNKYPDALKSLGVRENGLNLSLADVATLQYLNHLVSKNNKQHLITTESVVLMHNGELIGFNTTQNGLVKTSQNQLTLQKTATSEQNAEGEGL